MFEITGEHISLLGDEDLRTLVGRLCETELRSFGLSSLAVSWGGNQNAMDGGIDVRVSLLVQIPPESAIPRRSTGFQVKATEMPRSAIIAEMCPKGRIRPAIAELASQSGAYIIVSSRESLTYSSLASRHDAMAEAVQGLTNHKSLFLDFYDANRIATWVRGCAGLISWVRERVGNAVYGWKSYGSWAYSSEAVNATYLVDAALRIHGPEQRGENVSALAGIESIRARLSEPQSAIRLVGLSGVGKTRLAQALFDASIGSESLDPCQAVYTDLSEDPDPQPSALAADLLAQRMRAVLVVDNCPPQLHHRLSEVIRSPQSKLSLLSIEYDIREDQPEGTDVYRLYPSSDHLIEKLLETRFPTLSQLNARSVAKFSDGNARVAIALAATIKTGESVGELRDSELFDRLFQQRFAPSDSLLKTGKACALVYSFDGQNTSTDETAELCKLADLFNINDQELHSNLAELSRRGLLQRRGVWRAILPHAIANRLAALALEEIPTGVLNHFCGTSPARLLRSFSRRLGYLHTSERAREIASDWLSEEGLLGHPERLDDLGLSMLANVAPVAPAMTLDVLERAIGSDRSQPTRENERFSPLLSSLAYDAELFDKATHLLLGCSDGERNPKGTEFGRSFASFFQIAVSGTHATIEQRLQVVEGLLLSGSEKRRDLGLLCLAALLQTSMFSSFHHFEFGTRPRDYGFYPQTRDDVRHWFGLVLDFCKRIAPEPALGPEVGKIAAEKLRGLWCDVAMYDEVVDICRAYSAAGLWVEGWAAIESIRRWHKEPFAPEVESKLLLADRTLKPTTLLDRVRSVVFRNTNDDFIDPDADYMAELNRLQAVSMDLGRQVAVNSAALSALLPELVTAKELLNVAPFVKGLVDETVNCRELWDRMLSVFAKADPKQRRADLFGLFLVSLHSKDSELVETLLDESLENPLLAEYFPLLQSPVGSRGRAMERLRNSLERDTVPVRHYRSLIYMQDSITGQDAEWLIPMISRKDGGFAVAVEVLFSLIHSSKRTQSPMSPGLIRAGQALVATFDLEDTSDIEAYRLGEIAKTCLPGDQGYGVAQQVCERAKNSSHPWRIAYSDARSVFGSILAVQPIAVLDTFFPPGCTNSDTAYFLRVQIDDRWGSAFDNIPDEILLAWCNVERETRFVLIASLICPFREDTKSKTQSWTATALGILREAPRPVEVLKRYILRLEPTGWIGSQASAFEKNVSLLDYFAENPNLQVATHAAREKSRLLKVVDEIRRSEVAEERLQNERFE
jgi:hypothetical protein